jgi:Ca-activated chloride channel family protein
MVSVIVFDHEVDVVADASLPAGTESVADRFLDIHARGETNLSGGWLRGRELLAATRTERTANRLVLMTDGQANNGITDPAQLARLCATARELGLTTSTIGFGADYDEDLLKTMADSGGGNAWYIERADQAQDVFGEELAGLLSLSAQNLTVTVKPARRVEFVGIINDYPSHPVPGGVRVELGDLYAREPRRVLIEFIVPGAPGVSVGSAGNTPIASLIVGGAVLLPDGAVEQRMVTFSVASNLDAAGHVEPVIEREALLARAAQAREEAAKRRERGEINESSMLLREAAAELGNSAFAGEPEIRDQARDLEAMAERMRDEAMDGRDIKYLKQRAYNQRRGKAGYEQSLRRPDGE